MRKVSPIVQLLTTVRDCHQTGERATAELLADEKHYRSRIRMATQAGFIRILEDGAHELTARGLARLEADEQETEVTEGDHIPCPQCSGIARADSDVHPERHWVRQWRIYCPDCSRTTKWCASYETAHEEWNRGGYAELV